MIRSFAFFALLIFSSNLFAQNSVTYVSKMDDESYERSFQRLLKAGDVKLVESQTLGRMLNVRYLTEFAAQNFAAALTSNARSGKSQSIWEMPSYLELNGYRPTRDDADDEALFVFRRAHETLTGTGEARDREAASNIQMQYFRWIKRLDENDRLLISDWVDRLEELTEGYESAAADKANPKRAVASIRERADFNFASYNFAHQANLSKLFQKHADEIAAKAKKVASTWKDARIEKARAQFKIAGDAKKRAPSSLIYQPSVGPDGNFDGTAMAPRTYAFTFDDGPHPVNSEKVMDVASSYKDAVNTGVPLTFFWLETWVPKNSAAIERAKSLKYLLNSHSWSHKNLATVRPALLQTEIVKAVEMEREQFGPQPVLNGSKAFPYFRCPYGSCVDSKSASAREARRLIAEEKLLHIKWNVDSTDWAHVKNPQATRDITVNQLHTSDHGVILMHDFWPRSPEAFGMILDYIKGENAKGAGIKLISVQDGVAHVNGKATM